VDTESSRFKKTHAFLQKFHNDVINTDRVGTDPETGKSQTMVISGHGFEDPKTGKVKEYLLPSYDPETKTVLTDEEVRRKFWPQIESGEIEGFDSIGEAISTMHWIRNMIIGESQTHQ
jgi:streptogramin lyase